MAKKKRKEKQKNCFMYLATEGDIFHAEEREQKQYYSGSVVKTKI